MTKPINISHNTVPLNISYEQEIAMLKAEAEGFAEQNIDKYTAIKYSETKKGNLYYTVGLPRAGKTSLINKWKSEASNRVVVCFDNIRLAMYEREHFQQMEPFLWEFATTMGKTLMFSGYDVMMDDTHTSKWKRDYYKNLKGHGIYINTPIEICINRVPAGHVEFIAAVERMSGRLRDFNPEEENIAVVDWKTLSDPTEKT